MNDIDATIESLVHDFPEVTFEELSQFLSEVIGCNVQFAKSRMKRFLDSQVWGDSVSCIRTDH